MLELAQTLSVACVLLLQLLLLREQRKGGRTLREQGDELRELKTSLRPRARRIARFPEDDDDTPVER